VSYQVGHFSLSELMVWELCVIVKIVYFDILSIAGEDTMVVTLSH